jgi:hypothetical protein
MARGDYPAEFRRRVITTSEHAELVASKKRNRELETELAIHRRATDLLKKKSDRKNLRAIKAIAAEGLRFGVACRVLVVWGDPAATRTAIRSPLISIGSRDRGARRIVGFGRSGSPLPK